MWSKLGSALSGFVGGLGLWAYLAAFVVGAGLAGVAAWRVTSLVYEHVIDAQKIEAATLLQKLTDEANALRDARDAATAKANADALAKQKEIEDAHDRNVALGGELDAALGCLRVGGRWSGGRCAPGGAGAAPGHCDSLQASVDQLSGLMGRLAAAGTELARNADREAAVAAAAHEWAGRMGFAAE